MNPTAVPLRSRERSCPGARLGALAAVIAVLLGASSASAQRALDADARSRMHREALASGGLGMGILALSQVPLLVKWHGMPDPLDENYGWGMGMAFVGTTIAGGTIESVAGSGLITHMARSRGVRDGAGTLRSPYAWALLGQSSAWFASVVLGTVLWFVGPGKHDVIPTNSDVVQHYVTVVLMPELLQAWGGSYFGAYLVERHRDRATEGASRPSVTFAPFFEAGTPARPSFTLGVRGAF